MEELLIMKKGINTCDNESYVLKLLLIVNYFLGKKLRLDITPINIFFLDIIS